MVLFGRLVLLAATLAGTSHAFSRDEPIAVTGRATGINQTTGERPCRLNINQLSEQGGPYWDLFIRGLDALHNKPEDDEGSHFGVSGIHGMPYVAFNGVGADPAGPGGGYCPHMQTQFVAWHRAYLALYEQLLGDEVQRLACEYTGDKAPAYQYAADIFRLPYWDWASDASLPRASTAENITVNGPAGELTMHNPLFNYRWQSYPLNQTEFPGSGAWGPTTTRGGGSGFDPYYVNDNLTSAYDSIRDSVYRTFVASTTYDQMATMANYGSSFEAAHNVIHNLVGGSFPSLDTTSFDTLFFLHHCNVDRLAALWSAVHPNNTHQTTPYASGGLFATAAGTAITAASPLKPFYQADGRTFHTGLSVDTTEILGYTYAELKDGHLGDDAADAGRRNVIAAVNANYGGVLPREGGARAGGDGSTSSSSSSSSGYFVEVDVDRADLPLPCALEVRLQARLAGRSVMLAMPRAGRAHDEIPLDRVVDQLAMQGASRSDMAAKMQTQLAVVVKQDNGTTVDPRSIPSLRIDVITEDVVVPSDSSELPQYNNRNLLVRITG
ncbi:Di-copper centre-containing protein [Xylariomycetidae sp. FL0641]|nr:Di-copper centre-containing protein [Xylariomycetidae sp. FL0641]